LAQQHILIIEFALVLTV